MFYPRPPPHPLAGIRAKLDRGDEHVRAYEQCEHELMASANRPDIGIAVRIDREQSRAILRVVRVDELPLTLPALIGDAVHNFRSALDHLVFELTFTDSAGGSRLPRGQTLERTMFPDSDSLTNFEGIHVQTRLLAGLTQKHRAQLKRFQPYRHRKRTTTTHPVRLLIDLSNYDKHRLVQPVLMCASDIYVEVLESEMRDCHPAANPDWRSDLVLGVPLEPETEIASLSIEITGPQPQMKVKGTKTLFVGFRNGEGVLDALERMGAYAREIVEFFAPDFDRPQAVKLRTVPRPTRISPRASPPETEQTSGVVFAGE